MKDTNIRKELLKDTIKKNKKLYEKRFIEQLNKENNRSRIKELVDQ